SLSIMLPPPPSSTLFPYTTLFRSRERESKTAPPRAPLPAAAPRSPAAPASGVPAPRPAAAPPGATPPLPRPVLGRMPLSTLYTRSEEHTSELQSQSNLVCRLLLEK